QAGPVIKVKIPKDRDGRPKQFAFVNFKHEESVPYGLSLLNGIKLFGRPIKIQFRSGSSHASQEGSSSCSPHRAASASPAGAPLPASTCSSTSLTPEGLEPVSEPPKPTSFLFSFQMNSTMRLQPPFGGTYEQPGFTPPGYQHPPHSFHPSPALPVPRRPEDELGFDERGHHDAEHHYRGGREEPAYEDRHRDGWSHDYDYRRESYREGKWHPSRH
ncbi:RBM7 protein, partial [Eurystomus gularis]|nr:RBM7 protein [Eurystomus gularis]